MIAEEEKKIKSPEIIMKSSARVCLFRKSREWKEDSESWKSRIDVYSQWNIGVYNSVNEDQYLEWP